MKKHRFAAALLAAVIALCITACTEDTGSSDTKGASSSGSSSSAAESSEGTSSATETTGTTESTTEPMTTTASETVTSASETTKTIVQTEPENTFAFNDEIKADVESCKDGGIVDMYKLLEKWNINAGQVAWGGPNNKFTMQFRRDNADTKTECMVFSVKGDTAQSYVLYFDQKAGEYPSYKVGYGDEKLIMTGYDFVCLYRIVNYDDFSSCKTEPYVDMSLHMGE